ncbi:MAG: M1 family aminopeptidase [Acidobacteriota bacterium]
MRSTIRLFLLSLCLAHAAFAASSFDEVLKKQQGLTLGGMASVTDFKVTVGHMTITLPAGSVSIVKGGEEQVGLFLNGPGTFTYETVNKDELTVFQYNAKTNDQTVRGSTVQESFKSVLLRGNGLPEVTAGAGSSATEAFNSLRQTFARQQLADPAEHLLVMAAMNAPQARVVRADIEGASRPYVYLYDDAWTHQELFSLLRHPESRINKDSSWYYTTILSMQAIGRKERVAAPVHVILTDLDVNLVNTDKDDGKMTIVETLVPQGRAARALRFDLYSDYFFDINREPKHFYVRSVTDEAGNKLPFHHERGSLLVGLGQPAEAGKPVKLRFEIDGDFLHHPEGSQYWELGIEPWFPSLPIEHHYFTYHALVKVKKPYNVFTSGKTIRRESDGDWNILESKLDLPVDAIAILAGKYQFDEETQNGVTVRVASFVVKNAQAYKTLRGLAHAAIETYPTFLGPFPFDEITVIEKNDYGYGQAPAGLVFITKEAFTPKLGDANAFVQGINRRFAHEIAHMYWGHVVKTGSEQDQWIEEAFSDYSSALFLKMVGRKGEYDKALVNWKSDARDGNRVTIIPMANHISNPGDPLSRAIARQGLIYAKGAYLLSVLHRELGDAQFLTFLKSFQKSFRWKRGTTDDVMGLLQFMTKKDYGPWFEEYFYGTAMPK